MEIATHLNTVFDGPVKREKISLCKIYALRIVHVTISSNSVGTGHAVLSNDNRFAVTLIEKLGPPV